MKTEQLDDSAQQALDLELDVSRARDDDQDLEHTQQMPKKLSMFDSHNVSAVIYMKRLALKAHLIYHNCTLTSFSFSNIVEPG